jgi:hypothetical protein
MASIPNKTDTLGSPITARQLSAGATSTNTALSVNTRRITMRAVGADIRFSIGTGSQTATATSHFIANGERLDFAVPTSANIAVLRNSTTSGTIELTELG